MTVVDARRLVSRPLEVTLKRGAAAVEAHGASISALADALPDLPATARWPWIAASATRPDAGVEPWLLALRAGDELVGAAVLLDDLTGTVRRTTLAGTAEDHRGGL